MKNYAIEINSVGCKDCRERLQAGPRGLPRMTGKSGSARIALGRLERNPLAGLRLQGTSVQRGDPGRACALRLSLRRVQGPLRPVPRPARPLSASPTSVNKRLVRGLDYYTRTVFEVTSQDLGAQKAFVAGGRYDNLVEEMGGPSVPGIGFAFGMDRLASLIPELPAGKAPLYFLATVGEEARDFLIPLLKAFVASGMRLAYAPAATSLKSQMKYANSLGAEFVLILGEEEEDRGSYWYGTWRTGARGRWRWTLLPCLVW